MRIDTLACAVYSVVLSSCNTSMPKIHLYASESSTEKWIQVYCLSESPYLPNCTRTVNKGMATDAPVKRHTQNFGDFNIDPYASKSPA